MKKQVTYGDYGITVEDNNSISVTYKGEACETVKPVLRQVAEKCNFAYEATWTTQQLGNKLVDYLKKNHITTGENASKKNHVRIEIVMAEIEYSASDQDESPIGDTIAFSDACEGFNSIDIYVDGQLFETEDDEIELESEYSDYQSYNLEPELEWAEDEQNIIYSVGYYENTVCRVWEFEVENFDLEKLTEKWTCYDVSYADYEAKNHYLTLLYDGQELEEDLEESGFIKNHDYVQIWSMDDDCNV